MSIWNRNKEQDVPAPTAPPLDLGKQFGGIDLSKGQVVHLEKTADGKYTLIARWGRKDYDLCAIVEYTNGTTEFVSCFGTTLNPYAYSTRTQDNAVVHVSGDKATGDHGGSDDPQEVIHVTLNDRIRAIAMVVYSAKNSGPGSFYKYRVSTHVIEGVYLHVPTDGTRVSIEAVDANRDPNVYTVVPVVIHNGPNGPSVEAVELYSAPHNEHRPVLENGRVTMDAGLENAEKERPEDDD